VNEGSGGASTGGGGGSGGQSGGAGGQSGGAGGQSGGAGGQSGGAGGQSGGGSGGGSMDGGGACMQKVQFACVNCCRTNDNDGYLAFITKLKDFVCSNTSCTAYCPNMCADKDIEASCADCIIKKPIAGSVLIEVKQNCSQYGKPQCASFASCVESCMQ
jgi:hypothetical protein